MSEQPKAWLSPVRPDGLFNLNYGDTLLAASLVASEAWRIADLLNREPEWIGHLKVMEMEPGDVLIFSFPGRISQEQCEEFHKSVKRIPELEGIRSVVVGDGPSIGVIRPPRVDG